MHCEEENFDRARYDQINFADHHGVKKYGICIFPDLRLSRKPEKCLEEVVRKNDPFQFEGLPVLHQS